MFKHTFTALFLSLFVTGQATASTILVNDGTDTDSIGDPNTTVVSSSPAPEFSQPGFFGGAIGNTDVSAPDNSVAHRFSFAPSNMLFNAFLTIQVNEFFTGSANDRILIGNTTFGATAGQALVDVTSFAVTTGNTITIDLASTGVLAAVQSFGILDVLVTDDRNIDFIAFTIPEVPLPAAFWLMGVGIVGLARYSRR